MGHLSSELRRCKRRYKRAGRGKMRNRRWKHRLGPLIIYSKNDGIVESVRNIRGVDWCHVGCLNLLKLAPGGHIRRLLIWTESAFRQLNALYGTNTKGAALKSNYTLPRAIMTNADLSRIINSQEIQSVLRPKRQRQPIPKKRNPLKHPDLYAKLNPLFDEQLADLKKNYREGARIPTTKLLAPQRKKQKREAEKASKYTKEEKQNGRILESCVWTGYDFQIQGVVGQGKG